MYTQNNYRPALESLKKRGCSPGAPVNLFVDFSKGKDTNPGLQPNQPLKTVFAAQEKANAFAAVCAKASGSWHVVPESIQVKQPFPIPITYTTYDKGKATLTTSIQFNEKAAKSSRVYVCDVGAAAGLINADLARCQLGFRMDSYSSILSKCSEAKVIPSTPRECGAFQTGTLPIEDVDGNPGEDYKPATNPLVQFKIGGVLGTRAERWKREKDLFIDGIPLKSWSWI
ncbi:hypothetical protein HDU96_006016 [Phlyctochytrium bullatum]|nr:hypothetical protein HDU96_006016 [Phlyctochytrium bullatum]